MNRYVDRSPLWAAVLCLCAAFTPAVYASEPYVLLTLGAGPQPGASQTNRSVGIDLNLWQFERSPRQSLSLGVSYTYLDTNQGPNEHLHAFSIYPQLTLTPHETGWARSWLPASVEPFFFVRALGPSYISENSLGERDQAHHFAFQAQVGAGFTFLAANGQRRHVSLSWKHFSNAYLYSDNDGIDIPVVLSFGTQF